MEKLCVHYGTKLGSLSSDDYVYYNFPSPTALAHPSVEQNLRKLGFGYRAKYIQATANIIANEKPANWLHSLRTKSYPIAKESLLELAGVGPKVADCVVSLCPAPTLKASACSRSINPLQCPWIHMSGKSLHGITSFG